MKFIRLRFLISLPCFWVVLIFSLAGCNYNQNNSGYELQTESELNPDAPWQTEILGNLTGTWNAEQSFVNRDGTWKDEKKYSIWKWYYILDGHAIQDDWISIDSLDKEEIVGTNIRIFNKEENKWYMAWIDKSNRKLATFTAVNYNGTVVMNGINAAGRNIRNTFFNISQNDFDWKQEWTFDEGKTWVEVSKIHCERIID